MTGPMNRRVGISKFGRPAPLLKQINGKKITDTETHNGGALPKAKIREPDNEAAPPLSSSDEDDDLYRKGDAGIQKTKFLTKSLPKPSPSPYTGPSTQNGLNANYVDARSTGTTSKRPADGDAEKSSSHLTDSNGFIKTNKKAKRHSVGKKLVTFGKSSQSSNKSFSSKQSQSPEASSNLPRFKTRGASLSPSPEKRSSQREQTFKRPEGLLESDDDDSPVKSKFNRKNIEFDTSPVKPRPQFVKHDVGSDTMDFTSSRRSTTTAGRKIKSLSEQRNRSLGEVEESSQRPKFKRPEGIDDFGVSDEFNATTNIPSTQQVDIYMQNHDIDSESSLSDVLSTDIGEHSTPQTVCPMCNEAVDRELFQKYTNGGRMNVKKQTAFCMAHKRKTAQDTWKARHYPEIDWENLTLQFTKYQSALDDILQVRCPSHYASLLNEQIEKGKARTLLKSDDSLIPGYYGPRGLRVMTDFILKSFSDTLRQRAIEDRLVSARGYAGYVQAVLVPELAVRLIMDDMGVNEKNARKIMLESSALGEILHEEKRDIVKRGGDAEEY
ncbi:RTC4-like domain-containing protein [Xylariales sp. PMI_506]|nr:RTC4-like domain-containing protein [Xylariales sp. PMI_506]